MLEQEIQRTYRQTGRDETQKRGLVASVWAVVKEVARVAQSILENPWIDAGILVVAVLALSNTDKLVAWQDRVLKELKVLSTFGDAADDLQVEQHRLAKEVSPVIPPLPTSVVNPASNIFPALSASPTPSCDYPQTNPLLNLDHSPQTSASFDPYHLLRASIRDDARYECLALVNQEHGSDMQRLKESFTTLGHELEERDERIYRLECMVEELRMRVEVAENKVERVEGDVDAVKDLFAPEDDDHIEATATAISPLEPSPVSPPNGENPFRVTTSLRASQPQLSASTTLPVTYSTQPTQIPMYHSAESVYSDTSHAAVEDPSDWERLSTNSDF
ncbi:hypothetical protein HK097_007727 [Rhizophlyctis rosea]|uniref:Uncharacterized protein n=1 Tax=Rhizophlyctis rosea TaxID=64517 RepID=A0AAD5SEA2_9FUNG|nr:hypothetical protein HK097_007727 [Rhizophlyctis rosea]